MQILNVNYSDAQGGAARAVLRHHAELSRIGIDSKVFVQYKTRDDKNIYGPKTNIGKLFGFLKPDIDSVPLYLYPNRTKYPFYINWLPTPSDLKAAQFNADIVHLHWICGSTIHPKSLSRIRQPVIWTLHDMWPFTGGCSHSQGCPKYEEMCGYCPQLSSTKKYDLSHWIWKRKRKALKNLNIIAVSPSTWLAEKAKKSLLFKDLRIEVIPNGLNLEEFSPVDKDLARFLLNIPLKRKIILFGAHKATQNPFKGFRFLLSALNLLDNKDLAKRLELYVFGASAPQHEFTTGCPIRYLGNISDTISLRLLYSAADAFIAPSIQDNLPNTVMESMACGTPCIAFKVGGIPDLIDHKLNGYLAIHLDSNDLAKGIEWLFESDSILKSCSQEARKKVKLKFDIASTVKQYSSLYQEASAR